MSEFVLDAHHRLQDYLDDMLNGVKDGDQVLIFAHGGVNRNVSKLLTQKIQGTNGADKEGV